MARIYLDAPVTSVALLSRLRMGSDDPEAWSRFVSRYGPPLVDWCRKHGLQDSDARDVVQDLLIQLAKGMSRFQVDPSRRFRGWLRTVAHSVLCDWADRQVREMTGSGDSVVLRKLHELPDRDDLARRIEHEYDLEVLDAAMLRVQSRVEARTWEAFRLIGIEKLSGQDAASQLGMKVGSAFAAKSKVIRLLRDEIEKIDLEG